MEIQGYTLANPDKAERALNGSTTDKGALIGGVGAGAYQEENVWYRNGEALTEDEVITLETALLAEYDKIGGLIKKGQDNLKIGSFYDVKGKKPRTEPKVVFLYRVNGSEIEVPAGVEMPGIVKAARIMADEVATPKKKYTKKHG